MSHGSFCHLFSVHFLCPCVLARVLASDDTLWKQLCRSWHWLNLCIPASTVRQPGPAAAITWPDVREKFWSKWNNGSCHLAVQHSGVNLSDSRWRFWCFVATLCGRRLLAPLPSLAVFQILAELRVELNSSAFSSTVRREQAVKSCKISSSDI